MAKVRSGNRGPEGRLERDVTEPHSFQKGSWRNGLCCGTVEEEAEETQSGESHAKSRCEQPERGSASFHQKR